jgi:hypothetical protein
LECTAIAVLKDKIEIIGCFEHLDIFEDIGRGRESVEGSVMEGVL